MSYSEQMQRIANEFYSATGVEKATSREIAAWAIRNGLWEAQPAALVKQCAEELSKAMRDEYMTDLQGRRVRTKHAALREEDGKQLQFWADIRRAPREHMEAAFMQRRVQIVSDCCQLKTDVDSYNDNFNSGEAVQIVFDFTYDVEELETAEV